MRVYDEATKALSGSLKSGMGYGRDVTSGHSNRIFSVKYHPAEPHTILSGGWDNTIQVWDTRAGHSVREEIDSATVDFNSLCALISLKDAPFPPIISHINQAVVRSQSHLFMIAFARFGPSMVLTCAETV